MEQISIKSNSSSAKPIYLIIDPIFKGVKRLIVSSLENKDNRTVSTKYYLPTVEIKDCNVMIDGQNFFDKPFKSDLRTHDNIKIAIG